MRAHFGVDAGGTATKVICQRQNQERTTFTLPSINPCSNPASDDTLRLMFDMIRAHLGGTKAHGWIATSALSQENPYTEVARVQAAIHADYPEATVAVSNDVLPLLFACSTPWQGIVVISGTGSAVFGRGSKGGLVTAGGCEYLGSDEGSGADIGQQGLRAAVRAIDRRGQPTSIVNELKNRFPDSTPAKLARDIASAPFPKSRLADLARLVVAAWEDGDDVANDIINCAVQELTTGIRAVANAIDPASRQDVVVAGGVIDHAPGMVELIRQRVRQYVPHAEVRHVTSPETVVHAACVAAFDRTDLLTSTGLRNTQAWVIEAGEGPS